MKALGRWEIIRRLGAGGSAEVFLARPLDGGDEIALKVLLPHLAMDPAHVAMLLREARAVGSLSHPNIAQLLETGEVEGRTFLAMELVRGSPLSALTKTMREAGEKLSLGEAAYVVREAAKGLHHAHEKALIHRDVSPHNLMVSVDGEVKVVDFGLARATHEAATATGGFKGKLRYMPPEQVRAQTLDRRADVFALGAVLWELALGQPLYVGATEAEIFQKALTGPTTHPDEVGYGLPRAFVQLLSAAVMADREKRTPTAMALADALTPFVSRDAAAQWGRRVAQHSATSGDASAEPSGWGDRPARAARANAAETVEDEVDERPRSEPLKFRKRSLINIPKLTSPEFEMSRGKAIRRALIVAIPLVMGVTMIVIAQLSQEEPSAPPPPAPAYEDDVEIEEPAPPPELKGRAAPPVQEPEAVKRTEPAQMPEPAPAVAEPTRPREPDRRVTTTTPPTARAPAGQSNRGTLVLTASAPAFVRSGSMDLGMTPVTVQLPAGRRTLELTSPDGTHAARVEVEVPRGGIIETRVTLKPK